MLRFQTTNNQIWKIFFPKKAIVWQDKNEWAIK